MTDSTGRAGGAAGRVITHQLVMQPQAWEHPKWRAVAWTRKRIDGRQIRLGGLEVAG